MNLPDRHQALINGLLDSRCYQHPVAEITLIETHISSLILTGDYVYKIKKPLSLGFLDFSTLALRKHYCQEEVRLNKRLAGNLYLAVVTLSYASNGQVVIDSDGDETIIDYAVMMRQFDNQQQLDHCLERDQLTKEHCRVLGQRLAIFHEHCPATTGNDDTFGTGTTIQAASSDNFRDCLKLSTSPHECRRLEQLQQWSGNQNIAFTTYLNQRRQQGHVRECHGDLHLANIVLIDDQAIPFDCLEFNPSLRWIDTINEIAFLTMDLHGHNAAALANHVLNAYLETSGDYQGAALLHYYEVYRAIVRAKVCAIRRQQANTDTAALSAEFNGYLDLAEQRCRQRSPFLMITHGLSGSGKSVISSHLLARVEAIRIRADVERKRLFPNADKRYQAAATKATYEHLQSLAKSLLLGGHSALIDASFLDSQHRHNFHQLATELAIPFVILHTHADTDQLRQWICERNLAANDPSEATLDVLEQQIKNYQPLGEQELPFTITIDSSQWIDFDKLVEQLPAAANLL